MQTREERFAEAAKAYYIEHLERRQIAEAMGVSPHVVAEWLKKAEELGVVAFDINPSYARVGRSTKATENQATEMRLAFKLSHAGVIDPSDGRHLEPG
jgi:DNA-binding transcriptional regulator LsrR (DeoR family)